MLRNKMCTIGLLAILSIPVVFSMDPAIAQGPSTLSAADRTRAISIERRVDHQRSQQEMIAGAPAKSIITSVLPIGEITQVEGAATAPKTRRVEISRFVYATGETIRTVLDLDSGDVLATRVNKNFPTPLAPEELNDAKSLLISTVPDVEKIVNSSGISNVKFVHLVSVAPSSKSKRYGHRVVAIWITKPKRTRRYMVDLTTREVE